MKKLKLLKFSLLLIVSVLFMTSCETDANVASRNLSKAAEQFEVYRRVVFINGITDTYLLVVEGYCSVDVDVNKKLSVTVKTETGEYLKHYLGLSDNVTYLSEQLEASKVSTQHYRIIFKPSTIIPKIDIE